MKWSILNLFRNNPMTQYPLLLLKTSTRMRMKDKLDIGTIDINLNGLVIAYRRAPSKKSSHLIFKELNHCFFCSVGPSSKFRELLAKAKRVYTDCTQTELNQCFLNIIEIIFYTYRESLGEIKYWQKLSTYRIN
jgi:hypothetical protein